VEEPACPRRPRVLKTPSSIREETRNHSFTRDHSKGWKIKGVRYPLSYIEIVLKLKWISQSAKDVGEVLRDYEEGDVAQSHQC
jgi:hypothetical protein